MPDNGTVTYLVLADRAVPYLLARVRWPDVAQAISAASPDWLDDPGLFDLPYDPSAVTLSFPQAASVAAGWGRRLSPEATEDAPSYLRRMPANWSDLSRSELRTWGMEFVGRRRAAARRIPRLPPLQATGAGRDQLAKVATERRGQIRVRLDGRAHIRSEHTTISAGLVDLGERGLQCVLPEASPLVAPGVTLSGGFLLEAEVNASRICLDVPGRISWHRDTKAGTHFGVAFGDLAAGETEGVRWFLAAARRKRRPR
jgi:hypothetical protein